MSHCRKCLSITSQIMERMEKKIHCLDYELKIFSLASGSLKSSVRLRLGKWSVVLKLSEGFILFRGRQLWSTTVSSADPTMVLKCLRKLLRLVILTDWPGWVAKDGEMKLMRIAPLFLSSDPHKSQSCQIELFVSSGRCGNEGDRPGLQSRMIPKLG